MTNELETIKLAVEIEREPGMSDDDLDRLTRRVLCEVQQLDVESAELATGGPSPEGAKSVTLFTTLGVLLVKTLPQHLPKLLELLRDWMSRQRPTIEATVKNGEREITVKFTPSETSNTQLRALLDLLQERVGEEKRIILK